jgi:hypothetical protein
MKMILIDELLLAVHVPQRLPEKECRAIRRTLTGARFRTALEHALREAFQRYSSLSKIRITVSR